MPRVSDKPFGELSSIIGLDQQGNLRQEFLARTAVQIVEAAIPPEVDFVKTYGFYRPGDGGAATYARTSQASSLKSLDGAFWAVVDVQVNVRMFGARGDGTGDTDAIEAARRHSQAKVLAGRGGLGWTEPTAALTFPPGHYVYRGAGLHQTGGSLVLLADPRSVTIEIESDSYFMILEGRITHTHVRGFNFKGGRGAFRFLNTEHNVTCFHVFSDCLFHGYRECAIGNNSSDHPYLKVERCQFYGSDKGGSIGIAWGGYIDGLTLLDSDFLLNKYHVKLGPRLSGSISIVRNSFLSFEQGIRAADIWIVPNSTDKYGQNAGSSLIISQNKFGNENQTPSDARILVAQEEEGSGTDRLGRHHSSEWVAEGAYVKGVQIQNNRIDGIDGLTAPFIQSYINDFWRVDFDYNVVSGGIHTYLCEFMGPPVAEESGYATRTWKVALGSHGANGSHFSRGVSNRVLGLYEDLFGAEQGSPGSVLHASLGDDAGYLLLARMDSSQDLELSECTAQPVADSLGASARAAEFTVANSRSSVRKSLSRLIPERMAWVELDCKKAAKNSLQGIIIRVNNPRTGAVALRERILLNQFWQTARIPFIVPVTSRPDTWQISVMASDFEAGRASGFCIGRVKVYHARQPMNGGHLRTLGSGRWDGEHIILGESHLWVDSAGRLRINNRQPSGDNDGTMIG